METIRVNEDTVDGNYIIEVSTDKKKTWKYVLTEFSISEASFIGTNLQNAFDCNVRILSRRSKNQILAEF